VEQEYPGDIRPLMKACSDLAIRRRGDLHKLSSAVDHLRGNLANTLQQFAVDRGAAIRQVAALRSNLRDRLAQSRADRLQAVAGLRDRFATERQQLRSNLRDRLAQSRADRLQAVAGLRDRFATERQQTHQSLQQELGSFRKELANSVEAIRQRTAHAKTKRFKTGSFTLTPAKAVSKAKVTAVATPISKSAKRSAAMSFLDAIEY